MPLARNVKMIAGGGCALMVVVVIAVLGSATWYAARFSKEYKAVKRTEAELVAATADFDSWQPPAEGVAAGRLDAFLAVREALAPNLVTVAEASEAFATSSPGLWSRLSGGADLMPVYADFWRARNQALLEQRMSPLEYIFTYRLVYYGWLGNDPQAGVRDGQFDPGPASWLSPWVDEIPPATIDLLEQRRQRLTAAWSAAVNPLELIFDGLPK